MNEPVKCGSPSENWSDSRRREQTDLCVVLILIVQYIVWPVFYINVVLGMD